MKTMVAVAYGLTVLFAAFFTCSLAEPRMGIRKSVTTTNVKHVSVEDARDTENGHRLLQSSMCSNGVIGVENKNVCCPLECGTCGGEGCSSRARSAGLTEDDCCTSRIHDSGLYCSSEGVAPCIIDAYMCSNGVIGVEDNGVCCPLGCGTCGGTGCGSRASSAGLTVYDCCTGRIHDSGLYCSSEGVAPCIIDDANTCSNGVIGLENNGACCPLGCDICGGTGCSSRARSAGLTAYDCCTSRIHDSGLYCSSEGVAPCIIDDGPTPTPVNLPTPTPLNPPTPAPVDLPTPAPVDPPTPAPVDPPTPAPVDPPTPALVNPPTPSPVDPPTPAPVDPPTPAPVDLPTPAPVDPPTLAPVDPPTPTPVDPPTPAPVDPPTPAPVDPPTPSPVDPPTPAPMNPPTPTPVVSLTLAPVDPPTPSPVDPPMPAPVDPPTPAPVDPPTPAPVNPPTPAPVDPPTPAPVDPPTPAPVDPPTPAPVDPPTPAPVDPPTPAPIDPPTPAPMDPPTPAPVDPPTPAPVDPPTPAPVDPPTPAPTDPPTPAPTDPPTPAPTDPPTPAPTNPPTPAPVDPPTPTPVASSAPADMQALLDLHNNARCMHNANPLVYSEEVEASAQAYAEVLAADCGTFEHSEAGDRNSYGENLYQCGGSTECYTPEAAMLLLYDDEIQADSVLEYGGHATQILWKATTELGCAVESCTLDNVPYTNLVCHYNPAGNVLGQFEEQVELPSGAAC